MSINYVDRLKIKERFESLKNLIQSHYIMFTVFLIISTCTIGNHRLAMKRLKERQKEELVEKINRKKLNYVTYLSPGWRDYRPNLIGAVGWRITNCGHYPEKEILGEKIVVDSMDLGDTGWGNYHGTLYGRYIKNNHPTKVGYKCFKPDYNVGDWDFISIHDIE